MTDMDVDLAASICCHYDNVVMSGNHGDPIYHPRFHDLVSAIRARQQDMRFRIVTNGSSRGQQWWAQLAKLLGDHDEVTFSIDGLPHNNDLYRINSKWPSIEAGIRTLRENNPGLRLVWKWIIFAHNQDDIAAGAAMARSLGFNQFHCVWSTRYDQRFAEFIPTKNLQQIRETLDASS